MSRELVACSWDRRHGRVAGGVDHRSIAKRCFQIDRYPQVLSRKRASALGRAGANFHDDRGRTLPHRRHPRVPSLGRAGEPAVVSACTSRYPQMGDGCPASAQPMRTDAAKSSAICGRGRRERARRDVHSFQSASVNVTSHWRPTPSRTPARPQRRSARPRPLRVPARSPAT